MCASFSNFVHFHDLACYVTIFGPPVLKEQSPWSTSGWNRGSGATRTQTKGSIPIISLLFPLGKPPQEKQVQETDPDLVAGPGCFLRLASKELPVRMPPNLLRRCVSWSDVDPVIAM